jgi:D-3-phosphoglycerate dehydrogenase
VISKHGSGTDTIDKVAAEARGIKVGRRGRCERRRGGGAGPCAAARLRQVGVTLNERMHAGHWDKATHKSVELEGRTVGVIGLGAIGLRFARMADAMGMRVLGFDPYAKNLPAYVESTDLATIWRESDAISLHCPLTADNAKLINAQTLAACKKGVLIVNTARGGLIDEAGAARGHPLGPSRRCRPRQLRGRADDRTAPVPRRRRASRSARTSAASPRTPT